MQLTASDLWQNVTNKPLCVTGAKKGMLLTSYFSENIRQLVGMKSDFASISWDLIAMETEVNADEVPANPNEVPADGNEVPGSWSRWIGKC
ncbi:hypothetical protein M1P97_06045 [Parabacteroides sp. GYB001]|uniref:hypothetical protein n=1 Tax=Parabacteroides leei TaxID=2939491 RepID=UPI002017F98C|nr:hypothetical protein [Parabacteroides leei]MCL3850846.1 hypothetical protein [Parabacteroides leei]